MTLTAGEVSVLQTGIKADGTKASQSDIDAIKAKATATELLNVMNPKSGSLGDGVGLGVEKSTKPSLTPDQEKARKALADELGTTPEHLQEMVDVDGHEQLGKSVEGENKQFYPALAKKIAASDLAGEAEIAVAKRFDDKQDPTAAANKDNDGVSVAKVLQKSDNPWVKSLDYGQQTALAMELQPEIVKHQKEGKLDNYGCGTKDGEKEAKATGDPTVATWKFTQLKSITGYEESFVKGETKGTVAIPTPTGAPQGAGTSKKDKTDIYVNMGYNKNENYGRGEFARIVIPSDSPILDNPKIHKEYKKNGAANPEYKNEINLDVLLSLADKNGRIDCGDGTSISAEDLKKAVAKGQSLNGYSVAGKDIPDLTAE